jgi:pSer/pThr/pTyr-binding forkhead associated (FHA) protein
LLSDHGHQSLSNQHSMDTFLEACGAKGSLRLEIEGPRPGRVRSRVLVHPFAIVGRAPTSDVPLRHARVSLRHAYLQLVGGRLACFDLGGRDGVQWADGRPARAGWIDPGHPIEIGPFVIRRAGAVTSEGEGAPSSSFNLPSLSMSSNPAALRWEGPGPDVVLEFPDQSSGAGLSRWRMSRAVTLVGRAPGCRVRLPSADVSWYHSSLVRTPAGVWVVDLMSRSGVSVNGTPLRYGRLNDGDELKIGPFRIVLRQVDHGYRMSSPRGRRPAIMPPSQQAPAPPALNPLSALAVPAGALMAEPFDAGLAEILNSQRGNPALVMLVEQFGRMQQQMLEQFGATLSMMMEHMGAQYREQARLVRDELEQIRMLTAELIALRDQVPRAEPAPPAAVEPPRPTLAENGQRTQTPPPEPAPPRPEPSVAPDPSSNPAPKPATASPTPGEDPLVMVSRRIAAIRGEQRSHWQKILDLVRAK